MFVYLQREDLGALVSLEMGKIRTEGIGEVQEFVDIVSSSFTRRKARLTGRDISATMP